jgi:hypothetical protein
MIDPYQAFVQNRLGTSTPKQSTPTDGFQVHPISMPEYANNPFRSFIESTLTKRKQSAFDKGTADTNQSIQKNLNPGFLNTVKDTAYQFPGAFGQVLSEAFTHPLKTAESVLAGAIDVGPKIVNSLNNLAPKGRSPFSGEIVGKYLNSNENFTPLPLPGETAMNYIGNNSDIQEVIRGASTGVASYELGGGLVKSLGITNTILKPILGNIVGGQLASDAQTPRERVHQALFDGVFGLAEGVGSKIFKSLKDAPKITPEEIGGKITEIKDSPIPPKPANSIDVLQNPDAIEKPKVAKTAYIAKEDLGVDSQGKKVMATTQVDSKTGNAIVYYDAKLDSNPNLRQIVFDFEEPHIISKRLGGGQADFSSALSNPADNTEMLSKVLQNFADKEGRTVEQISNDLASEIKNVSKSNKSLSEQFADAYGIYKNNPKKIISEAPTFAKFMESPVMEGRYSTSIKNADEIARGIPEHASQIEHIASGKSTDIPNTDNIISVGDKHYELTGESKTKYLEAKAQADSVTKSPYSSDSSKKAVGMRLSALKRELTGDYTSTEINNLLKKEQSNYVGKEVVVKINGLDYYGNISGKSSYGRVSVILKDGHDIKVNGSDIRDPRTTSDILAKITDRPESKLFSPKKSTEVPIENKPTEVKPKPNEVKPQENPKPKESKKSKPNEKIASTGLDTGKKVEDRSSFNPKYNSATQDVEIFMNKMDAENANFSEQRISKSNEDIKDLSRLVGITPDELIAAKPGSLANSETITAARQMVLDKASQLMNEIKGKSAETITNADRLSIKNKFVELVAVQKSVAGFRTEASNALRSFGIELTAGENITLDELLANLQKMGVASNEDAALFASKIADDVALTNTQKIGKGALNTWYAAILSGPKTTVRNILSTMSNVVTDLASKTTTPKGIKEIVPYVTGLFKGYSEAKGALLEDLKNVATLKTENPSTGKFQDFNAPIKDSIFTGKWATYGKITESVGRFLNAQDKFMSAGVQEAERAALKASTPEISDAISEAISKAYAESTVYHGTPKGRLISAAVKHTTAFLKDVPEARIIVPFVKTVGNVIDRQFDYIPVFSALRLKPEAIARQVEIIAKDFEITDQVTKDFIGKRLRDQQIGRMNLGMAVSTASAVLATKGLISGIGPANYNERIQLQRTGWRPNSIKIGDTWVPYTFLGPLSGIFSIAGNIHDKITYDNTSNKNIATLLANGIVGWTQTNLSNSFLSGASDLIDVVNGGKDPVDWLNKLGANLVPIPAIYSQTKDIGLNIVSNVTGDETLKQRYQTKNIVDAVRVRLGLTGNIFGMKELQPKLDMFGEPMTNDLIFGITPSKEKGAAAEVDNFLISHDTYVTIPLKNSKYTNSDDKDVKLTPEQYTKYVQESGKQIYATLSENIRSDNFNGMTDEEIKNEIQKIVTRTRSDVRDELLQ